MRDMPFSAPGEYDDPEIIMSALLLYPAEVLTQLSVGQKQAQARPVIPVLVFLQDFFCVHDNLLSLIMKDRDIRGVDETPQRSFLTTCFFAINC